MSRRRVRTLASKRFGVHLVGVGLGTLFLACAREPESPEPATGAPNVESQEGVEAELPPDAIRVYYDELRAPHIFAETDADLFYGLGYTQMRDFPVATLANLWSTTGRFAEIAGARVLQRDVRVRTWGIDEVARRQVEEEELLDSRIRRILKAYIQGVNAGRVFWLERPEMVRSLMGSENQVWIDPVPPWMNPDYTGHDPLVIFRHMLESEVALFNVLTLGVALNAGTEFFGGGYVLGTNVWLARNPESKPGMLALMDAHQPVKRDGLRSYPIQLHGRNFRMSGIAMPGYPCIFSGFSSEFFFGLSTPPKKPGPVLYSNLPFRLNERVPQTTMRWEAQLEEGDPPRIVVDGEDAYVLEERSAQLRIFDPDTNRVVDDPVGVRYFYRVPPLEGELEGSGIGHPVTSPAPGVKLNPSTYPRIVFEGRSFLSSRNAMETFLGVGYSKRTGGGRLGLDNVLARSRLSFGRAEIFLAGDVEGGMEYVLLTHAPKPGEEARKARSWETKALLDGRSSGTRWGDFHSFSELPQLARPPGYDERHEVWLNCNTSPHFVRPLDADPYRFEGPPWLYDDQSWKTLRHDRARALFDRFERDHAFEMEDIQEIALDTQDAWAERMWPWLWVMNEDPGLSLNARDLLEWFDVERFLDKDREHGPDQFLAHVDSQIMPFVTLLMGWFEDAMAKLSTPLAHEIAFAYDPSLELPSLEDFLTEPRWERTRETLRQVLDKVGTLWVATRDAQKGGLVTHDYLALLEPCAPVIPQPWRNKEELARNPNLVWGDINHYLMTPHVLPKPVVNRRESWLLSLLKPCLFTQLTPYFAQQQTALAPVPGTRTSIFHAHSQSLSHMNEKLFPTSEGLVYFVPVDFASQVMFTVELAPEKTARAAMMPSMGATEILIDLPENGTAAGDHFAPFGKFLEGEWTDFPQQESELEKAHQRWYYLQRR